MRESRKCTDPQIHSFRAKWNLCTHLNGTGREQNLVSYIYQTAGLWSSSRTHFPPCCAGVNHAKWSTQSKAEVAKDIYPCCQQWHETCKFGRHPEKKVRPGSYNQEINKQIERLCSLDVTVLWKRPGVWSPKHTPSGPVRAQCRRWPTKSARVRVPLTLMRTPHGVA